MNEGYLPGPTNEQYAPRSHQNSKMEGGATGNYFMFHCPLAGLASLCIANAKVPKVSNNKVLSKQ